MSHNNILISKIKMEAYIYELHYEAKLKHNVGVTKRIGCAGFHLTGGHHHEVEHEWIVFPLPHISADVSSMFHAASLGPNDKADFPCDLI